MGLCGASTNGAVYPIQIKFVFGISYFTTTLVQYQYPCYVVQAVSTLSEFRASLSKVLTLWHCVKVKHRYHKYLRLPILERKSDL